MKKLFVSILALTMLVGCTTENNSSVSEPTPSTQVSYTYIKALENTEAYDQLNNKYIGNEVNWVVKNQDTDEEMDVSKIDGAKIIELYSGFCDVCLKQAPFVNEFIEANKNISYISISKEKSSIETQKLRDNGFDKELYYFPGEIPLEAARLWDIGRPGYIIIDENNKIMFLTGGNLTKNNYDILLNPIKDLLTEPEEVIDNGYNPELCEGCQ